MRVCEKRQVGLKYRYIINFYTIGLKCVLYKTHKLKLYRIIRIKQ